MSEYHYVFVHPGQPQDQLISDLSWACGIQLQPTESEFIDYAANLGYAAVEVEFSHDYEEDQGMPFERYQSLFTVRDFDSNIPRQEGLARQIFARLASLGRYSLLLTLDLQQFIDATPPIPGTGAGAGTGSDRN
ncbi:hypothetical protein [Streptomyces sp. WM6386]|uniref:hypothetical protein n=1 Tax=Streptomyces sp. WM6386 TaxID=1415558 RepID=UPI0006196861|nr:hypothetical protein [Streptomyces sp. WM6386]